MTAQLIDGKAIAANVRQQVAEKISARQQAGARGTWTSCCCGRGRPSLPCLCQQQTPRL